jgi:transposase-like protein
MLMNNVEIMLDCGRRRRWSGEEKLRIVAEALLLRQRKRRASASS